MAHIAATNAHIAANQLATHDTLHHIIAQLNAMAFNASNTGLM
jgi:hypothetical protein